MAIRPTRSPRSSCPASALLASGATPLLCLPCRISFTLDVARGRNHIAYDLITDLFRVSTRGSAPHHPGFVMEAILGMIAWVGRTFLFCFAL